MQQATGLADALRLTASTVLERIAQYVPSVLGAVVLLIAGWVLARVLRMFAGRLMALLDRSLVRLLGQGRASALGLGRSAELLGVIVFWSVLLFFLAAATSVLGLDTFAQLFGRLIDQLPTLLAGLLIVAAGYVVSRLVGDLVLGAASRLEPAQRTVLARAAQITVLTAAILIGADQIGVRVTFLAIFVGAAAAAVVAGVVVAVSLGARMHVANLIGARAFAQEFERGQYIRIAGIEGRVIEARGGGIVLETEAGRAVLPGRLALQEPVVLLVAGAPVAEPVGKPSAEPSGKPSAEPSDG
ncbi:MAG: hypothetical protein JSW68_15435 [Burkholderiales bacterium]|nr:MAG: hypothetical protein JSW68_15435 [Burkholderiales bacterium]